jgi:essential nuclear protein 1
VCRDEETGVAATRRAFTAVTSEKRMDSDSDNEEDGGYSDTEEHHEEFDEVTEEDEKILSMFMASDATPQRTLADIIMERIHEAGVSGDATANVEGGGRSIPGIDKKVIEVYQGVGKLLGRYRSGKLPKAFKIIPSLSNWEEIMYLTDPEKWSPNAMYQATRVFASNFNARMAQRFYNLVLLPRIRQDIKEHKRLHFALYQSLKKAVYKPSAFYKGVLLPLCQVRS